MSTRPFHTSARLAASLRAKGMMVVRLIDNGRTNIKAKQARYIRRFGPNVCFIITEAGNALPSPA